MRLSPATILIPGMLLALAACAEKNADHGQKAPVRPSLSATAGAFSFAVPPVDLGDKDQGKATLEVVLTSAAAKITETLPYIEGELREVGQLDPGTYKLELTLNDGSNHPLYKGESEVTVTAGEVSVAQVTLTQLTKPEDKGGVLIGIDTKQSYYSGCDLYNDAMAGIDPFAKPVPSDKPTQSDKPDQSPAQTDKPNQGPVVADQPTQDAPTQDAPVQQDAPAQDAPVQQDDPCQVDTPAQGSVSQVAQDDKGCDPAQDDGDDVAQSDDVSQSPVQQDDTWQWDWPSTISTTGYYMNSYHNYRHGDGSDGYFCAVIVDGNVQLGWKASTIANAKAKLYKSLCRKDISITADHAAKIRCVEALNSTTFTVTAN